MTPAEKNYDIGNRELLTVRFALEKWRPWLEEAKHRFLVLSDHNNLDYLRTAKRLNFRQAHWALFFGRFNFTLSYRPRSRNNKADALSRQFEPPDDEAEGEFIIPATSRLAAATLGIEQEVLKSLEHTPAPSTCPDGCLFGPKNLRAKVPE